MTILATLRWSHGTLILTRKVIKQKQKQQNNNKITVDKHNI